MHRHRLLVAAVLFCVFLPMPCRASEPTVLTVSAAISLKNAFTEIGASFKAKNPGIDIAFNFGGSGALARQIEGGAPVDIFASASSRDMDAIEHKKLIITRTRTVFVSNSIVCIQPSGAKLRLSCIEDLQKPALRRIGIGNPRTVPAGRYAADVLAYFKLNNALKEKLILGENVRQVLDYVVRGEVDAGLVYKTDALTQPEGVRVFFTAPAKAHAPVVYPIGVIQGTKNEAASRAFVRFVTSDGTARAIFEKYGFTRP